MRLAVAIENDDLEEARRLLDEEGLGQDPDAQQASVVNEQDDFYDPFRKGLTPLMLASWRNRLAIARLLLERGANVHFTGLFRRISLDVCRGFSSSRGCCHGRPVVCWSMARRSTAPTSLSNTRP